MAATLPYKNMHVIVNPSSGQEEPVLGNLNRALADVDLTWDLSITHQDGDGARLAREAIENGSDLICVYGGDGTINDVLQGMHPSKVPLVLLAGGTGNEAARALGIPQNIEQALAHLKTGRAYTRRIDIGRANERLFMLRLDMGKLVEIINQQDRSFKKMLGRWSYVQAMVESLSTADSMGVRLKTADATYEREAVSVMVMNMSYLDESGVADPTEMLPDDGLFDVLLVKQGLVEVVKAATVAMKFVDMQQWMETYQCGSFEIETDEPMALMIDGEDFGETPVKVELLPQALTLLLPEEE